MGNVLMAVRGKGVEAASQMICDRLSAGTRFTGLMLSAFRLVDLSPGAVRFAFSASNDNSDSERRLHAAALLTAAQFAVTLASEALAERGLSFAVGLDAELAFETAPKFEVSVDTDLSNLSRAEDGAQVATVRFLGLSDGEQLGTVRLAGVVGTAK